MKTKIISSLAVTALTTIAALAGNTTTPSLSGDYLEIRSCDVYTGSCFANAEMGLSGKEGIMVWSVRQGSWQGTQLDGLKVIAVVHTDGTLGDQRYQPRVGQAVLIVDEKADAQQRQALSDLARTLSGGLIGSVVDTKAVAIEASIGACTKSGCASVKAGKLVNVATRCFSDKDHICGNEETFYPPLSEVTSAWPAYTELAAFKGSGLGVTWEATGQRSAFIGSFAR
jgi:hypothetical protein